MYFPQFHLIFEVIELDCSCPRLLEEVSHAIPSSTGRYVALVSRQCVYIVELHADFWSGNSLFTERNVERLKARYTARCVDLLY